MTLYEVVNMVNIPAYQSTLPSINTKITENIIYLVLPNQKLIGLYDYFEGSIGTAINTVFEDVYFYFRYV